MGAPGAASFRYADERVMVAGFCHPHVHAVDPSLGELQALVAGVAEIAAEAARRGVLSETSVAAMFGGARG